MAIDLDRILKIHAGLLGAAFAVAWLTRWADPASIVLGGAVMGLNFWLMRIIADALTRRAAGAGGDRRAAVALGALTLKFGLFLALIAALFTHVPVEGMSFALGVTALLISCVVEATRGDRLHVKGVG